MQISTTQINIMNNFKLNKPLTPTITLAAFILASASFSTISFASDIGQNLRNNTQEITSTENYLEIGMMYAAGNGPSFSEDGSWSDTVLIVNGSYNWNNLFVESYSESGHGLVIGYNAYNSDDWSFDFTATTDWGQLNFDNNGRYASLNNQEYSDELTLGVRLTGYLGNNLIQFAIDQDATGDHNGTTASALIGRNWQIRNWNFHGIVGVEYASAKLNNFYVGVSEERAASGRFDYYAGGASAYEAGSSISFSSEVGVTYPITEDWVFRATGRVATISEEVTDSPYYINKDSIATSFRTSLSFVF